MRCWLAVLALCVVGARSATLCGHEVILDHEGKIMSWFTPQQNTLMRLCFKIMAYLDLDVPVDQTTGLPMYYIWGSAVNGTGRHWPHTPAQMVAGMIDAHLTYFQFTGDILSMKHHVLAFVHYMMTNGTTPDGWVYPKVPYASSDAGDPYWRGANSSNYTHHANCQEGVGDGIGVIEPDKVASVGRSMLNLNLIQSEGDFVAQAIACGDALAINVEDSPSEYVSPWPFRVYAETGKVMEPYTAHMVSALRYFDRALQLQAHLPQGSVKLRNGTTMERFAAYRRARSIALEWLLTFPLKNNLWVGFCEDVCVALDLCDGKPCNVNAFTMTETALYLLDMQDAVSPTWLQDAWGIVRYLEKTLIFNNVPNEPSVQWGARTVSEQLVDRNKMGYYTGQYGNILALLYKYEGGTNDTLLDLAFRAINWQTYMVQENGDVVIGPVDTSVWYNNLPEVMSLMLRAMGAHPDWAPAEKNHILTTTCLITDQHKPISKGKDFEYWSAPECMPSTDVLRLTFNATFVGMGKNSATNVLHTCAKDQKEDCYLWDAPYLTVYHSLPYVKAKQA